MPWHWQRKYFIIFQYEKVDDKKKKNIKKKKESLLKKKKKPNLSQLDAQASKSLLT